MSLDFFIKLKKPHIGPILEPFWLKNLKTKFFQQIIQVNLKSLCQCNFIKKLGKFHVLLFMIPEKPRFGPIK